MRVTSSLASMCIRRRFWLKWAVGTGYSSACVVQTFLRSDRADGALQYMDLRGLLYEKAQSLGAEIRTGCIVSSIDSEARTVTLASGESLTADVIIAADGPSGVGRTALIGRETESTPGGYVLYQ